MNDRAGFPLGEIRRIDALRETLGLREEDLEPYGWYKGKFALGLEERLAERPLGKYVAVTAISPTPLGEGKTVMAIGLAMGLNRIGCRALAALREPSLGPLFGMKGGGAGGGRAHLVPADDINLHFTGDIHAVSTATNLLAALLDNHLARRRTPLVEEGSVTWRRCLDLCDRSLRGVETGRGDAAGWITRSTAFDLAPASEIMAVLALASNLGDLIGRIGRMVVGVSPEGTPVTVDQLQATGALAALLRDAVRPNLVQTCEGTPALVHAGPFANIAHGNSSVLADRIGLRLADYIVTESGFGADCGAEKFMNIKCRASGLTPDVVVLVCTARALKLHSGQFALQNRRSLPPGLSREDLPALRAGAVNLHAHLALLRRFGIPIVVAINRFPDDTDAELELIRELAREAGADEVAVSTAFSDGSRGAEALAEAVVGAGAPPAQFRLLYEDSLSPREKLERIATQIYGADGVDLEPAAREQLDRFDSFGYGRLPVCVAKTQYSLSHDPHRLGRPTGFRLPVREVRLAAGAGFLYALAGDISTMPGLPSEPAALRIRVNASGTIQHLH